MPVFTPEQLAQIQALLSKNSSSQDDSDDQGAALAQAMKSDATAPSGDATPAPAKVTTPGASADWSPGQPPVDASNPVTDVSGGIPQPNGGMNPQQLAAEIASNPGPIATTGFNPNNPGPVDKFVDQTKGPTPAASDSDEDEATPAAKAVQSTPQTSSPDAAVQSTATLADLANKTQGSPTAPTQDPNAALAAAQKQGSLIKLFAGLGLGAGSEQYNNYIKANDPVAKLQQQQAYQSAQTENQLKNYSLADEQEKNDPNSAASNLARSVLTSSAKQAGMNLGDVSKLSASSIEKTFPSVAKLIDTQQNALQRAESSKERLAYMQQMAGNKQGQAQQKNFNTTAQALEQMRGSPAVSQAEKDLYASQKANSLATMYGDPNKLSQSQVQLLATEVGKIAAGGVSSDHALQGITPNTLAGRMSKVTSDFTNTPTPANAAAFVKQFQDYTGALAKDAQNTITDRYSRILNPARRAQLTDEQNAALDSQYTNRFKTAGPQSVQQAPASQQIAPDVAAYAQQHGITPAQALAIKNQRTAQ